MPTIQNKRLMIARVEGIARTCEAYSGAGKKRLETSRPVVLGDGTSRVHYVHDPAMGNDPVTLRFVITRDDPFVRAAEVALELHRLDPNTAGPITLQAYSDAGAVVGSKTLTKAVIQELRYPDGDVNANGELTMELIVQPSDTLTF